jgi:hypothetical protein
LATCTRMATRKPPRLFCLMHTWRLHQQASTSLLAITGRSTRVRLRRLRLQQRYLKCAVRCDYSSHGRTGPTSLRLAVRLLVVRITPALLRLCRASGCLGTSRGLSSTTRHRQLRLRRASGCLGTSRGSSRDSSRRSSLTTPPRAGSSSTTSPLPRVRVPRHVARLVTRLVAPLVIDYSSSTTSPPPRVRVPRHVARLVA